MSRAMSSRIMLLTGCASGIGRHLAGALSARGHVVVATDLDEAGLARAADAQGWDRSRVTLRGLDVRSEQGWDAAVEAAVSAHGRLDVLMNIAGYLQPAYVADIAARDVDLHLDVNVKGVVLGTRAAARRMIAQRAGHIVNIGSLASLAPVPGLSLYSASKFAVRGFTLAAATELQAHGVAVTLVMPDAVDTPMLDKQVPFEEAAMTFSGPRALTVEDIERLIVDTVLPSRPLEVTIPRSRGLLARFANTAPAAVQRLGPRLVELGKRRQARIKGRTGRSSA
jgi:3-oxoacyl-[acyl-carrier protein] reductase